MSSLTAAAFLALAATCGPEVAPQTLLSIAKVESDLSPWVVHDNTAKREYSPTSAEKAVELAKHLRAAGHNIDSGVMQVNSGNWGWLGVSLEDTFDPCLNIRAAATELTSYSRYNTGSPTRGFANGYIAKIRQAADGAKNVEVADAAPVVPLPPHDWDVFHDEDSAALPAAPPPVQTVNAAEPPVDLSLEVSVVATPLAEN